MRMLAPTLRRNVRDGAFQNFQQRLLHAFAGNIAGDRRILVLLGNLIDLVDIDDALLGFGDVAIGGLQQLQNNVLDVFADVARFGKRRGVHDCERHVQHARQGLRQQRLARSRRPNQQNVGLGELHFAGLAVQEDALVMIVNGYRQFLFRLVLTDYVLVQEALDLRRPRQAAIRGRSLLALFFVQNLLADGDALVADKRARIVGRRADELLDLLLRLMAEGTA